MVRPATLIVTFQEEYKLTIADDGCEVPRLLNIVRGSVTKWYKQSEKTHYLNERPDQYDFSLS